MKISIVTCTFNSEATIEHTLQSVIAQTYTNVEYIIVDGLSNDGTLLKVEDYKSNIAKVISEKDTGIYDAINKGVRAATGDVVGLMHADDFFAHDMVLENVAKHLEQTKADALYTDLQYVQQQQPDKVVRHWKSGKFSRNKFLWGWMPPHPTFYARRMLFEQFGLYRTDMRISADYELMLRMMYKHQIDISYLPEVAVKMRVGGASNASWKNRLEANQQDRKAWKVNDLKPLPFTSIAKPLRKIGQFL